MAYEYSGYLKTLHLEPAQSEAQKAPAIVFTPEDIAKWVITDTPAEKEWVNTPARIKSEDDTLTLSGNFEQVRRIDSLERDDPSFWVPLTSSKSDTRFPIDLSRYPIVEITYRCITPWARPAWMFNYAGGASFDGLKPVREWRTVVRKIPHSGFPRVLDSLTLRLYSVSRSTESIQIKTIRFRAPTLAEKQALSQHYHRLEQEDPIPHYPVLDEFMPLGVYVKAAAANHMAETMDLDFDDYWRLAIEDIARRQQNCIVLEDVEAFTKTELNAFLSLADQRGLRVLVLHDWPLDVFQNDLPQLQEYIDAHIVPFKDHPAIFAWSIKHNPPDHAFPTLLRARKMIHEADPKHPLAVMMRDPHSFPLFSRFFPATGMAHFKSHMPWDIDQLIATHLPLSQGQHLWITAPTFVYATGTPDWNSSPELRLMLNTALASGARGWFSFAFNNDPIWLGGNCQRSLTGPFLTFSDLWSELGMRIERLNILSPLFLQSRPCKDPQPGIQVRAVSHSRTQLERSVDIIQEHWLEGPGFALLYIVNNDVSEVTSVYITLNPDLPKGLEVYDLTDFVRSRCWSPMASERHLEMFPGQGQLLLVAEPGICAQWCDRLSENIIQADQRHIGLDMELIERFDIPKDTLDALARSTHKGSPLAQLAQMRSLRESLTNLIYSTPQLCEPRSKIIHASAAVCGCDGALCRLLGKGKADAAHELGLRLLPLSREMARQRLLLRKGQVEGLLEASDKLARRCNELLAAIRDAV